MRNREMCGVGKALALAAVGIVLGAAVTAAHARCYTLLDEPAATATPTATPVSK